PPPESEEVAGGDAQPSTDVHTDTPAQTPAAAAAANPAQPAPIACFPHPETGSRVPDSSAVQRLMDGASNTPAPTAAAHPQNAAPAPTATPVTNAPHANA